MSRRGKIARLPKGIREKINRRLENGYEGRKIIAWLNGLPAVKRILAEKFGGREVTDGNLHEWRRRGFVEWQMERKAQALAQSMLKDAQDGSNEGGALNGTVAVMLAARSVEVAGKLLLHSTDPEAWKGMRELTRSVSALRRAEQREVWLRLRKQDLALKLRKMRIEGGLINCDYQSTVKDVLCG